ncbi:MAG: Gfo/Idh/MocA family oxidoreductase, partial [Phycisphaeraceae bacterium]
MLRGMTGSALRIDRENAAGGQRLIAKGDTIMHRPVNVGVVGCGAISGKYFNMARKLPILNITACCDLDPAKAREAAETHGTVKACTLEQMLADDSIEIILNLTIPIAHGAVALKAIEAGKHTFAEKPLALDRDEAGRVLAAAAERKVRVGCAPDTFLGSGIQTARKLLDDGAIGQVTGFMAYMLSGGPESWHPNPEFYYQPGGGPMLDMG